MRLLLFPAIASAIGFSGMSFADPVGVLKISPSSEYERLHDDYAFGEPGPRLTIRGKPAFWIRMDTPAEGNSDATATSERSSSATSRAPGKEINSASVFFATGSAHPLDVGILDFLRRSDTAEIAITGRTDAVGSVPYNITLSRKRAERVASYLEKSGVDGSRIRVIAKGKSDPVAVNATSDGRARNRQVHVEVVTK